MAEMNMPQRGQRKVKAPRIDLTPMVDLGFLLITFFMYTTAMAKQNTMDINMPMPTDGTPTAFTAESTITLIPVKDHAVIYYKGILEDPSQLKKSGFNNNAVRAVLMQCTKDAAALPTSFSKDAHKLHVIIKPNDDCKYDDVVTLLDEMNILDVPYYSLVDLTKEEKDVLMKKF